MVGDTERDICKKGIKNETKQVYATVTHKRRA